MRRSLSLHRVTPWIAVLAMLAAGWMAPVHASHVGDFAPGMEVCTTQGLVVVHAGGEGGSPHGGASLFEHCPLCSAGAALPPSAPGGGFLVPAAASALPIPTLQRGPHKAAPAWPAARPRAPPSVLFFA